MPKVKILTVKVMIPAAVAGMLICSCRQNKDWRTLLQSQDPVERITGAIEAAKRKDIHAVGLLAERLEDEDEAVRMYAIMALKRITGTDLGYKYWADELDRARAAQRWRDYIKGKYRPGGEGPQDRSGTPQRDNASTQPAGSSKRG